MGRDGRRIDHAPSGPRREWRRRGRRRTPPLGAALARAAGIGAAPMGGARRSRDAAGRVGRGTLPGRLPSLRAGRGSRGRGRAASARTMATARPTYRRRPPRGGKELMGGQRNDGARAGSLGAYDSRTRAQGRRASAAFIGCAPPAEICPAACQMPPPGISLRKSHFFSELVCIVPYANYSLKTCFCARPKRNAWGWAH